ncbi:MAG: hypothetical protein SPD86_00115, partial [Prevotella sp.]|nr:hypothetical protein [Prevotella sp.]
VKVGSDVDLRDVQFQLQSLQGAGIKNPFKYAFCMSDGNLASTEYLAGDYDNTNLVITIAKSNVADEGVIDGTVKVNNTTYTAPVETSVNQILSIEATDGTNYKFVSWSTGSKDKKIQLTATGMNMGLTAFFKKNG